MQHTTTIGNRTLLFVKMPEGADIEDIDILNLNDKNLMLCAGDLVLNSPLAGRWQLLGKVSEITELVAESIVEEFSPLSLFYYKDYESAEHFYSSALESFRSLLRKERIYLVNPYGEKPICKPKCKCTTEQIHACLGDDVLWSTSEERTGLWVLLIENLK